MSKSTPLMILTAAALFSGVAGAATRTTVKPAKPAATAIVAKPVSKPVTVASSKTIAKPTMVKPVAVAAPAKPVMKMAAVRPAPAPAPAPAGRMVSAKLANGKTVTYNCSLAGNATKKACR